MICLANKNECWSLHLRIGMATNSHRDQSPLLFAKGMMPRVARGFHNRSGYYNLFSSMNEPTLIGRWQ